jgi:hypothetical protein
VVVVMIGTGVLSCPGLFDESLAQRLWSSSIWDSDSWSFCCNSWIYVIASPNNDALSICGSTAVKMKSYSDFLKAADDQMISSLRKMTTSAEAHNNLLQVKYTSMLLLLPR